MAKLTDKACKKHGLLFSEGIALLAISSTTDDGVQSSVFSNRQSHDRLGLLAISDW